MAAACTGQPIPSLETCSGLRQSIVNEQCTLLVGASLANAQGQRSQCSRIGRMRPAAVRALKAGGRAYACE